jgi:SulP family sulfate permease
MFPQIIQAALAIAFLGGIESLLSAVVADGMTGRRHRSQMELVSQGLANVSSSLVGGLPATGAIVRTATNIQSGSVSPLSGMTHSLTILFLMLFLGSSISLIPLSAMSGILMVIAYRMGEWHHFTRIFRCPIGDVAILLSTFILTVVVDLLTAIQVGIILAAFISINRLAEVSGMKDLRDAVHQEEFPEDFQAVQFLQENKDIEVYEIYGSLFFAAMEKFMIVLTRIERKPKVLILRLGQLVTIDSSGISLLFDLLDKTKKNGTCLLISGINEKNLVYKALAKSGLADALGKESIFYNFNDALDYAKRVVYTE